MGKLFKLIDPSNNSDALGGAIDRGNSFLSLCLAAKVNKDDHNLDDLLVGESALYQFQSAGMKATYRVLRVQDGPRPGSTETPDNRTVVEGVNYGS